MTRLRVKPYRCGYPCDHPIDPATPPSLDVCSYGGGKQSTALLVLAAQGIIPTRTFLFANVGEDSEHPAALAYVEEVAKPYAALHGIDLQELRRVRRDGTPYPTIWQDAMRENSRSIDVPMRMAGGSPGRRKCTSDWKIKVIARWVRAHGATPEHPASIAVGFSQDEALRISSRQAADYETLVYPLIGVGLDTGLHMTRDDCVRIIRDAGLPVPHKSACFFCPFQRPSTWAEQARTEPELFARSAELEDAFNARRDMLGKDHVYLTRYGVPLREAIDTDQPLLPMLDDTDSQCDSGYCWT